MENELKQLILDELNFRSEFREIRSELEKLVKPITFNNKKCCEFWSKNFPDTDEIIVEFNNSTVKISKPKREECSVESYLPYGIDFVDIKIIKCD